jgi:hypothetical protein
MVERNILEVSRNRWLIKETGNYYTSAGEAFKAIKLDFRSIVSSKGDIIISQLNWETTTVVGKLAVEVLVNTEGDLK